MDDEKTLAEEVEEEEVSEEVEEDAKEEEVSEEVDAERYTIDQVYDLLDKLSKTLEERLDGLASVIIDAGAVVRRDVDEAYHDLDLVEDQLKPLEELDYSL